jgi:predicted nucleotidyltransferase
VEQQSDVVNPEQSIELPSLKWVKSKLRNNVTFRVRENVLAAYVIGSIAKGTAKANSDLDIALVIPAKRRISALRLSERFHLKMDLTGGIYPTFLGRRVDFEFFFPGNAILATYPAIKLT